MDAMTLREAAQRTARSITTLRRYIRSGRLRAHKRPGRFGPEYFVRDEDLSAAGLETLPRDSNPGEGPSAGELVPRIAPLPAAPAEPHSVPLLLYQELQMKHEQLLVQYGMIRASGLRVFELKNELETKRRELEESRDRVAKLKQQLSRETDRLKQLLRRAELEQKGKGLEISALREKVRALEMLTRNAVTNETIEQQFSEVLEQTRRVERLKEPRRSGPDRPAPPTPDAETSDH